MAKEERILSVLIVAFSLSLLGLFIGVFQPSITGAAVESTTSQVVISSYVALSKSTNLTGGIDFGTISTLPVRGVNATGNYNFSNNKTVYYVSISPDSNSAVDFCIKADAFNTSGGAEIGLGNYTWSDFAANNITHPEPYPTITGMSTNYITGSLAVAVGSDNAYRFFLNVTAAQPPGTYNNTVNIQGVPTGDSCT